MTRRFTTMMVLALVLILLPMQVKAAEEMQFVELQAEAYYKEVENDGFLEQNGSSIKIEEALFKVNSTLTEGWGQYKNEGKLVEGSFKEATLDTKGYLRCQFAPEGSTTYSACVVKVRFVRNWATEQKKSTRITAAKRVTAVTALTTPDQPVDDNQPDKPDKPDKPDDEDPNFPGIVEDEDTGDEDPGFPGIVD